MAFAFYKDKFVNENKISIPISNRAFNYADGLFESICCVNKSPLFFEEHRRRIIHGLSVLQMELPENFLSVNLSKTIYELLTKNKFQNAKVRLSIFRNEGGLYTPEESNASILITAKELSKKLFEFNSQGKRMMLFEEATKPYSVFSAFKNNSSLVYVLAGIKKEKKGFDDCLILNQNHKVCEALHSNIFYVRNNEVYTPAPTQGCIAGVMRGEIIKVLNKNKIKIVQGCISLYDLYYADEIFTTNVVEGIVPVKEFAGRTDYQNKFTRNIHKLFVKNVSKEFVL